jgi:hypothetical protein
MNTSKLQRLCMLAAAVTAGAVVVSTASQAQAAACTIQFNSRAGLNNMSDQARASIATYPWYDQVCGTHTLFFIPLDDSHYHLGFEDPTIGACFINSGYGRLINGVCTQPDWAGENRFAMAHSATEHIGFYPGNGQTFNMGNFLIKGTQPATVAFLQNGVWWQWTSLPPGFWNLSQASGVLQVNVSGAPSATGPATWDSVDVSGL